MVLYRKRFLCEDERIMRMGKDLTVIRSTQYPESQLADYAPAILTERYSGQAIDPDPDAEAVEIGIGIENKK